MTTHSARLTRVFVTCAVVSGCAAAWLAAQLTRSADGHAVATRVVLVAPHAAPRTFRLRRGERAVTVDATVSSAAGAPSPGAQVDLYASGASGGSATGRVLAAAQVLAVAGGEAAARRRLTLRVGDAQVAALIRADVFAKELRAIVCP